MAAERSRPRFAGIEEIWGEYEELTIQVNWNVSDDWSISSLIGLTQQQRVETPLDSKKDTAFRNALAELAARLRAGKVNDNCKTEVLDKLATIKGFNLEDFISFLEEGGNFYDGEKTTTLYSDYHPAISGGTQTVAQFLDRQDGVHAFTAIGKRFTTLTIFFDPAFIETKTKTSLISGDKLSGLTTSNLAFAFHEALHGYGNYIGKGVANGYFDSDLLSLFGLDGSGGSIAISDYIEKNCIKGVSEE